MVIVDFLCCQEGKKVYVVGEGVLIYELYKVGFIIIDVNFDFVIVGEMCFYNWDMMYKVVYFVVNGVCFIVINSDIYGCGFYFVCGVLCVGIEKIFGCKLFYVGKFSLWIICVVLNKMQVYLEEMVIVGDNLCIDILVGFQVGLEMILVFFGVLLFDDIDSMFFCFSWIYLLVVEIDVI